MHEAARVLLVMRPQQTERPGESQAGNGAQDTGRAKQSNCEICGAIPAGISH
jgi:hypothetical protein